MGIAIRSEIYNSFKFLITLDVSFFSFASHAKYAVSGSLLDEYLCV